MQVLYYLMMKMIFDFSSVALNHFIIYAILFNYFHESMTHETKTWTHDLTCTSLYNTGKVGNFPHVGHNSQIYVLSAV